MSYVLGGVCGRRIREPASYEALLETIKVDPSKDLATETSLATLDADLG